MVFLRIAFSAPPAIILKYLETIFPLSLTRVLHPKTYRTELQLSISVLSIGSAMEHTQTDIVGEIHKIKLDNKN